MVLHACHSLSADGSGTDVLKYKQACGKLHACFFRSRKELIHMNLSKKQIIIGAAAAAAVIVIVVVFALIFLQAGRENETPDPSQTTLQTTLPPETETTAPTVETVDAEDPQPTIEDGAQAQLPTAPPEDDPTVAAAFGIDVSKYQGVIDWEQVAASGIDFAMIRVGYRAKISGEITADSTAEYNIQQALKYGIHVGVYFFSTAVSTTEASEEAAWVADFIKDYSITYPVAYNCEGFTDPENRQYSLTKQERTDIALQFLSDIESLGYSPMFYAAKSEMAGNAQWETSRIDSKYLIWVANYPALPYPDTARSDYSGKHSMWQYTANGTVPGISSPTDLNVAYFAIEDNGISNSGQEEVDVPWDDVMQFKAVNEQVTAKEKTNLRDIPSQGDDATVLYTLTNGEVATRIGISDYGWSKLEFQGKIYYAVSSYLTTDLTPPEYQIQTQFEKVNDQVTAKDVVNLRTLPSVTHEDSEIVAQLTRGEIITRTGINEELGWSRVEYNGQELYCVSQYLMPAEELNQETEETAEATENTDPT